MIGRAKKNGVRPLLEKAIANENIGICPVCNKKVNNHDHIARKIDGLWLCSMSCIDKFLKEKKKWTPKDWDTLCDMQALFEERKRAEISNTKQESAKSGGNSLVSGLYLDRNAVH